MHPLYFEYVTRKKEPTLRDLENEVLAIAKKIQYIRNCELSDEVTSLAIKELQEQKKELIKLMHTTVDKL